MGRKKKAALRECGCLKSRPCKCGADGGKEAMIDSAACGICVVCLRNAKLHASNATAGYRKCWRAKEIATLDEYDWFEIPQVHLFFKMDKALKADRPNYNPSFQRVYQMSVTMKEMIEKRETIIHDTKALIHMLSAELVEANRRISELKNLSPSDKNYRKRKKQLEIMESTGIHGTLHGSAVQKVHVDALIVALKKNLRRADESLTTPVAEIKAITEAVRNRTATEIQRVLRGALYRKKKHTEWFYLLSQTAAAIEIQITYRRFVAYKTARVIKDALEAHQRLEATTIMQRLCRGRRGRQLAADRRQQLKEYEEDFAARIIQSCFQIMQAKRIRWSKKAVVQEVEQSNNEDEAILILQRVFRGFSARIRVKRMRIEDSLSGRVRLLAENFMSKGDLWTFLQAVDADYRAYEKALAQERDTARMFVERMIEKREAEAEVKRQEWALATATADERVMNFQQSQAAYIPVSTPSNIKVVKGDDDDGGDPTDPLEMQIATYADDYDARVIRRGLAAGYTLSDVMVALRGLQAQGQNRVTSSSLLLKTLKGRTPLMLNSHKSEKSVRKHLKDNPTGSMAVASSKRIRNKKMKMQLAEPVSDKFNTAGARSHRNITRDLKSLEEPIERVLRLAAVRTYVPIIPNPDEEEDVTTSVKGYFAQDDGPFEAYLKLPMGFAKTRRERVAWAAVEDFVPTLLSNGISSLGDITRNSVQKLLDSSNNIPEPLCRALLRICQDFNNTYRRMDIHSIIGQSTGVISRKNHRDISLNNTINELCISSHMTQFLEEEPPSRVLPPVKTVSHHTPQQNVTFPNIITVPKSTILETTAQRKLFKTLKSDIDTNVLRPLSLNAPLCEMLFQAYFCIIPVIGEEGKTLDQQNFIDFLEMLTVTPAESTETIKERAYRASMVSKPIVSQLASIGLVVVSDLIETLTHDMPSLETFLPPMLLRELSHIIGKIITSTCEVPPSSCGSHNNECERHERYHYHHRRLTTSPLPASPSATRKLKPINSSVIVPSQRHVAKSNITTSSSLVDTSLLYTS